MSKIAYAQKLPEPDVVWRCSSCGQVDPDEIQEPRFGFEGEAWGTFHRQHIPDMIISACCRAEIHDQYGEEKSIYD